METLHGNLMETEAAMETQAAPAFFLAALDGDAETVSKMLSTAGAQSLINYQHALGDTPLLTALGATPLLAAAANGHVAVTEQLLEARCNVDLQMQDGASALYIAAKMGMCLSRNSSLLRAVTSMCRKSLLPHRYSSRPKMDMLPSQLRSLKPAVTWIFRKMGAHRSSSRPKMGMLPRRSS